MSTIKQRTFYVDDKKITIKSRPQSYVGNFSGWYVFINNKKMFVNALTRQLAEDIAYVRWVNSLPMPEAIAKGISLRRELKCGYCHRCGKKIS